MAKESAALVPFAQSYPALASNPAEIFDLMTANLPGATVGLADLTRWGLGGARANEFKNIDGERAAALEGVIMAARAGGRGLYLDPWQPGSKQYPDCFSPDGRHGVINADAFAEKKIAEPTGTCATCQYKPFGSYKLVPGMASISGNAPACKERVILMFMPKNAEAPHVLTLPATQLDSLKGYLMRKLSQARLNVFEVETKITVQDGKVKMERGADVPQDFVAGIAQFAAQLRDVLASLDPDSVNAVEHAAGGTDS